MTNNRQISRRTALGKLLAGAAVGLAPSVVPSNVLGLDGNVAPSERVTLGVIGLGHRNRSNLSNFLTHKDVHCLVVCDCFADRRKIGKEMVDTLQTRGAPTRTWSLLDHARQFWDTAARFPDYQDILRGVLGGCGV